jgi:hypothetical protein
MSAMERLRLAAERKAERDRARRLAAAEEAARLREAASMGPGDVAVGGSGGDTDGGGAYIAFASTERDFGTVYDDGELRASFELVNEGTEDLVITGITTSCGCTAANKEAILNKPILPGESDVLEVTYKPRGPGEGMQTVTVRSNSRGGETTTLRVMADYVAPARLSERYTNVGRVSAAEGATATAFV